jgi:hypothetical protein
MKEDILGKTLRFQAYVKAYGGWYYSEKEREILEDSKVLWEE